MARAVTETKRGLSFGPFNLFVGERLLTKGGAPVELGARAFDILNVLTSSPNEIVSKKDLMARVWPDVTVEESNLRFHMVSLRKALGDEKGRARYIKTIPGRGYCFVSPISQILSAYDSTPNAAGDFLHADLPTRLSRMVGREDDVFKLSAQLRASRFVTIVGPGGIGKTTVALAIAHGLLADFAGSVLFVDLGVLSDPSLAATTVASMLGLSIHSDDAAPALISFLKSKRILLVLDTCEHLVEAVAALAAGIMEAAPQVHILATSREALRVEGEHIYRLDALACPPDATTCTAAEIEQFPATQLFVERALASGANLSMSDVEAAIVANICRKLDGVALAIELASMRVGLYGLQQTAALLDQRLELLWLGSRTAPARQQTLQATLDWSYDLLSELERAVLRSLAIFVGDFSLDAALQVVTGPALNRATVSRAIDNLLAKSMVTARPIGALTRYRLLDTTRAYALAIPMANSELADLASRHATYYRSWLEEAGTEWSTLSTRAERASHLAALNNVRAALDWCFGKDGDVKIGVRLATAAAPVFLAMSLLPECHQWSQRAILALDDANRGGGEEMRLQSAKGISLMFTRGGQDAARVALSRSLAIAEDCCGPLDQVRALGSLSMFFLRAGDFKAALNHASRCSALAQTVDDEVAIQLAHSVLGVSLHESGDLRSARAELDHAISPLRFERTTALHLGFEAKYLAGAALARTLWLLGHPAQAVERAHQTVEDAAATDHSLTLCIALTWAISVFLWTGNLESAEEHIDWVISRATPNSLAPYVTVAHGFEGELANRRGDAKRGVEILQDSLRVLHATPYEVQTTTLEISLVQGLAALGRFEEGILLIDEAMRRVERNGNDMYIPELLRVRGSLLCRSQRPVDEAERCLTQSLELSRRQGARAWELRAAIDLAALWANLGRSDEARALLQSVFQQFIEGADTTDLKAAQRLLATLG